ncbi:MAG: UDP-N-acetylmuramoyl-L-alanyl-D-glutamate--2,6-diaminopimelate ligase [Lachnospiraceae bacterium]|nr:UDP-N-acetylmuramoyl-L-alanyl-D-glutamate--2,6-diaminopimelate ligase [Lachnospiraceae bacterium]
MNHKNLSDVLENTSYTIVKGDLHVQINDVVYDSRKANKDNAFVCIIGAVTDGHKYIESTLQQGCKVIVIERDLEELPVLDAYRDITVIKTESTKKALAAMAAAIYDYPDKKLTTIAITGTKGKTTTSFMIRDILEQHGKKVGVIGTTGIYMGEKFIENPNTTPQSYEIHKYFSMMLEEGCDTCVMEVSSQALKLDRTYQIMFDYGIFTNLAPDHIGENEHADYDEYVYCKSLLFKQCVHGVFNIDDEETSKMVKNAVCDIHTFGFNSIADLYADHIDYIVRPGFIGIGIDLHGTIEEHIEVSIPGKFSAYNAMAAIMTAELIGVEIRDIKAALSNTFVKGRVETVKISDQFTLLIDYAHNAMSMESLLSTIRKYHPKRIVSLFGCGGNRSKLRRYEMGETSGRLADLSVITADNSRFENVMDIIEDIKVGMKKTDGEYVVIPDRKEAIRYCIENAKAGDIVLLLGKGHEDYQEIEGVKHPFDERVIIKEILDEIGDNYLK